MNSNARNAMIARLKQPSRPLNAVIAKGRNRGKTPKCYYRLGKNGLDSLFKEVRVFKELAPFAQALLFLRKQQEISGTPAGRQSLCPEHAQRGCLPGDDFCQVSFFGHSFLSLQFALFFHCTFLNLTTIPSDSCFKDGVRVLFGLCFPCWSFN